MGFVNIESKEETTSSETEGREQGIYSNMGNRRYTGKHTILSQLLAKRIDYILEWNLDNPSVCILSVPFSLKGISTCTNHVNVYKLYAVELYIKTVCSLDYPFQFRIF